VLQERRVRGVGETQETTIDVRMLAATNRDIEEEVRQGRFRQDLYYRLNVIRLPMPPLRDRREDISDLAQYFLARCAEEHGKDIRSLSPDALRALQAYSFPGNVRELENFIERGVALATSVQLGLGDLPSELSGDLAKAMPSLVSLPPDGCNLEEVVNEVERRLILEALERSGGVRTNAAKLLNISFRSLRYRLQKLAMDPGDDEIPSGERRWIKD
jgi:two-component system response regulator PilR (NtrC family)